MQKLFQCLTIMFFLAFVLNESAFSANELYRSSASGNWNANGTWEMSTNGGGSWFAATSTPRDTSGTITIRNPNTVTVTVNTTANQLVLDSGGVLAVNVGVILTITSGTGNDVNLVSGSILNGPGTVRTQGTIELGVPPGSAFNAPLNVNTGSTLLNDVNSQLFGNITIDAGATLWGGNLSGRVYTIYGSVTNNGILTATSTNGHIIMKGPSLVNNGSIPAAGHFYFDSTTSVSGIGSFTTANQYITPKGNVTLLSDITIAPTAGLTMQAGAAVLNVNGFVMTYSSGTFSLNAGNTVNGPGTVRTQNSVGLYTGNSSLFKADLKINTGTTFSGTSGVDRFFGNVTIDNGATYNCGNTSGRITHLYGSVTNNGILTATSTNGHITMKGPSLINNGSIQAAGHFYFDSTTSVSGSGSFTTANQYITPKGNVTLLSNITIAPTAFFTMQAGAAVLNVNGFVMTYGSGEFILNAGNTVNGPGIVRTQGNVAIYTGNSSAFNADINVNAGSLTSGTGAVDRIFGNVTIDIGASYNCGWSSGRRTDFYGNITNNGTLYASSLGGHIRIKGPSLVNNGSVSSAGTFYFDTTTSVSGTGSFTSPNQYISPSGKITLMSNITMSPSATLTMLPGAALLNLNGFVNDL